MPRPAWFARLVLALACSLLFTSVALARTWSVPSEVATIAAAIDSAQAGDTVELACGTYLEHDLVLKAGVTIRGETGLPDCAIIDAQQLGRVFIAQDLASTAVLFGLNITGGLAGGDGERGGAILCEDSSVNLMNCRLTDNRADYDGGAIYAMNSTMLVYSSELAHNVSDHGAGGAIRGYELDGEFFNSLFEANVAVDGAGVALSRSSPLINWCTFYANEGWFFGGGLFLVTESNPDIYHCTFAANTAHLGAGIMAADNSIPTIEVCIVAFNGDGAGIEVHDMGSGLNNFRCNDVHGNEGGGYSGHVTDQTGIMDNMDLDPLFCDLAGGDLTLASVSPCLPLNNPCTSLIGAQVEGCVLTPAADLPGAVVRLEPNRPNPFNPRTEIRFSLEHAGPASLRVYDLAGRLVNELLAGPVEAGTHAVVWTGRDARGFEVPSGTYLYRLEAAGQALNGRMQLVR